MEDEQVLANIPKSFLEAYPHPAFVLIAPLSLRTRPRLISRDTDVTVRPYEDISPLTAPSRRSSTTDTVVWGNEKWYTLVKGRSLGECLDIQAQNRLQEWIEDVNQDNSTPRAMGGPSQTSTMNMPHILSMSNPPATLHLSKTTLPFTPSHVLCIITCQPGGSPAAPESASITRTVQHPMERKQSSTSTSTSSNGNGHRGSDFVSSSLDNRLSTSSDNTLSSESASPGRRPFIGATYFQNGLTIREGRASQGSKHPRAPSSHSDQMSPSPLSLSLSQQPKQSINPKAKEYWQLVDSIDWSKTSLGPRSKWKSAIDPLLSVTFESKSQDCIWLGPELNLLYNAAYSELVDHPNSFGKPGREVWKEVWGQIGPIAEACMAGTPSYRENDPVFFTRYGIHDTLAEKYYSWRYVPIVGHDGSVQGIFNQCIDTTDTVVLERRANVLRELGEQMVLARNTREYFDSISESFERNASDVPFAMTYRVNQTGVDHSHVHVQLTLESLIGVPEKHPSAPPSLTLSIPERSSRAGLHANAEKLSSPTLSAISALSSNSWPILHTSRDGEFPILKALTTRRAVVVEDCTDLIKDYPIRQWDELPFSAIVVPICNEGSVELPDTVLILGINVRSPFDGDYDNFVRAIRAQLASAWQSAKAYEAEQQMAQDNERMEKAKAAWFRGAAHDLRSPLTLISGPIADLLDTELTANQRHSVTVAQRNVDRLMRLINALMDFSRLEAGRMEGRFVPTDLGAFVGELAAVFRPAIERLQIEYVVDVQASDKLVYIDPTLIETVVSNIIGNALKYTPSGKIIVRVRYTDYAEISVIDTGIGIPFEEIPLVTEWFHRASTVVHSGTQGTGLGLALAKELLHLHQGELVVESQTHGEEHGSTFTARIPLSFKPSPAVSPSSPIAFGTYGNAVAAEAMRWSLPQDDDDSDNAAESVASSKIGAGDVLFGKDNVILCVDDNRDMREYIKRVFSPHCRVLTACNGQQALEMAIRQPPDLILSDVVMPIMGGMELLKEVRSHPVTRLVPMVLLSAVAGEEPKMEALLLGAEDYLAKPFKPRELVVRVHLHLQVGKKRIKMEKLFSAREAEIAVLSDHCPSGILRSDAQGNLVYANTAWRQQSGLLNTESLDGWTEYLDVVTRERLQTAWSDFLVGTDQELRLTWKWGNGKTISGLFIRLELFGSGLKGILGCTTDISHEEQRLIEAEQRRREAEESKHQQELLIDLTSHEIRTPVSAILQCSSLVKENLVALKDQLHAADKVDKGFVPSPVLLDELEQDVEALESIYQCGLVQERIAGDILSLARIQLDMLSLHDIEVDMRKEARKVLSVFASEAKMKQIQLDLLFGETIEQTGVLSVKTDPVRLGQVVTNLIANAIRFTASAETRKITVRYDVSFLPPADNSCAMPSYIGMPSTPPAEDTPLWLFVSVTDTGPGMTAKELSILFQRFAQGNKMIHTKYGGSGLGLFICRKITELLDGRIEVLSQLGQGSVFRFFIRTRTVAPPSALATYLAAANHSSLQPSNNMVRSISLTPSSSVTSGAGVSTSSEGSSPPTSTDHTQKKSEHILIVEDNIINQTVLKRQIIKAGLTCEVANNGLEALNLIRESQRQARRDPTSSRRKMFDVVLMDLEMPVMDGLTAIRELRAAEAAGHLERNNVIALTGNARQGQIDQALAEGMDDVVIKPYVLGNLLKKIRGLCGKRVEAEASKRSKDER